MNKIFYRTTIPQKILLILILAASNGSAFFVPPFPSHLKPVLSLAEARGIEYVSQFPSYKDTHGYGESPHCLNPSLLSSLNSTVDWNYPQSYQIKSLKDLYIVKMHKAFIAPAYTGTIFDNTQQLLFETFVRPGKPLFMQINSHLLNYNVISLDKVATVQGPTYYYHWVIDRLPSIFLMKDLILADPEIKLIINTGSGSVSQYVHAYLDLLGIPREQRIVTPANTLIYGETIYFATPFLMEPIPQKLLLALRDQLITAAYKQQRSSYHDNLIVIIQRTEPDRKIQNLQQLVTLVQSVYANKDYQIIIFDARMPLAEQIQIFNNAKLVIGVMASGLTNVLFSKPGTKVIEIHPTLSSLTLDDYGRNNSGYEWCWWLASAVGLEYWFVTVPFTIYTPSITCPLTEIETILRTIEPQKFVFRTPKKRKDTNANKNNFLPFI